MSSKTPQLDKTLDEVLGDLKPHKRTCKTCQGEFEIFQEDIEMYHKLRVPPPRECPLCRMQRRTASYVRLPPFYRRKCTAPGHSESVITLFPSLSPHLVYDNTFWRSDAWDELEYGRVYDDKKSFFTQFRKLFFDVPHQAIFVDPQSVNSEYSIGGVAGKNCYYVSAPVYSEDILYAWAPMHSRDSVDVYGIERSEFMYESINCQNSYDCNFCLEARNCRDSWFLYDCRNCENCFMCANLRNKSYCFFNQQLSKEEYLDKINGIVLSKRSILQKYKSNFENLYRNAVHRHVEMINSPGSLGDKLYDCRNCFRAFAAYDNCEDIRYVQYALSSKDTMDVWGIDRSSLVYESSGIAGSSNIEFSANLRNCSFVEYSMYCRDSDYCFASVGLRNKKFCIFNRQYGEDEYWSVLDEIKTTMLNNQEYGEFFPLQLGLASYQNTFSQKEFPLEKEEALRLGIPWYDDFDSVLPQNITVLDPADVPDDISDVGDDILEKAIRCEVTGRPFRIVKQELEFYRKKGLPLPVRHPDQRMRERFDKVNRFRLWQYPCSKCSKMIWTSYAQEKKLKVYCESCYLKEVV